MIEIVFMLGFFIVLLVSSIIISNFMFKSKVSNVVAELFRKSKAAKPGVVTEDDIRDLPEPVQRFLRFTGIIGKEKIFSVRLKQRGFIRRGEGQKWMPFEAEQYYSIDPPGFVWYATVKSAPFLSIKARDCFFEGKGNMLIKLLGLVKIADAKGDEMDQGALVRYFNEMFWFPGAYLSDYVRWEPVDSNSARATFSYGGVTASAVIYFNEKGEVSNFVADRYMEVDGKFVMEKWSTPVKEYREMSGIIIPVKGEAVWNLSSGDFSYIRLEIIDIEYNKPSMY